MKFYTKPVLQCIEIRAEERLAAVCDNHGGCGKVVTDKSGKPLDFNKNGIPDYFMVS